eukprot:TRINITY_DN27466_c0_g1_i1.p1 TRINITY_DN27466_c0_g1~~TRINITY_DN27466_c0_g1_i1.p1  ORF type:complete len:248 (+),score=43.32 TRINITY_DN27466_c0_g1_i1:26-769(+)
MESIRESLESWAWGLVAEGRQCCAPGPREREPTGAEKGTKRPGQSAFPGPPQQSEAAQTRQPQAATQAGATMPQLQQSNAAVSAGASASKKLPYKWEWPSWCFNPGRIDVWVEDDMPAGGKWIAARTVGRVVDKSGNDSFLSAEYDWDGKGDLFVQDFGPQHVRKSGDNRTVFQLLTSGASAGPAGQGGGYAAKDDLDATKVHSKTGGSNNRSGPPVPPLDLDATKLFSKANKRASLGEEDPDVLFR